MAVTARDCFQVFGLADLFKLSYRKIGRHYGKNIALKVGGTLFRSLQLLPTALKERPVLALSHGSRSQLIAASMTRIPVVMITDYEHGKEVGFVEPGWVIIPEVIPERVIQFDKTHILKYPGIKEDVYVNNFIPDPSIKDELDLREDDIVVTLRPPATEAHYHNPESEGLFSKVVNFIGKKSNTRMVILPRNEKTQTSSFKKMWPDWVNTGKIIIPQHAISGLNLIWYSDLVVSGGGTMNREAAALGVPVYSIFRGEIGAVDRYLVDTRRLTLIQNPQDIHKKIALSRRNRPQNPKTPKRAALHQIVDHIEAIVKL